MESIDLASAKEMVGPGWAGLLGVLYTAMPAEVVVTTVKEKFGGLRVYYDGGTEQFDRLCEHLEAASTQVCEQCGKLGQRRTLHGWISALCEEHHRERRRASNEATGHSPAPPAITPTTTGPSAAGA